MLARNRTAPQSAEVTGCGAGVAFFITIAGGAAAGAVSAWRLSGELFVAAVMTPLAPAQAQSFTRGGTNSTTTTTDCNLGTNWSNPPTGAPPVVATQSAIFDTTGSASVAVTSQQFSFWLFG
jgi:hypothetical protein